MPQLSTPPTHADGISDERRLKKQPEAERCERGHDELDDGRLEGWALVDDDEAPASVAHMATMNPMASAVAQSKPRRSA